MCIVGHPTTYTVMMSAMVGELLVVGLVDLLSKCAVRQCQVCVGQSIIQKGEGQSKWMFHLVTRLWLMLILTY